MCQFNFSEQHFFCIYLYILALHIDSYQSQNAMDASVVVSPATCSAMEKLQSIYKEQMSGSSQAQVNEARLAMIATARDLITSLETPLESIIWMARPEVRDHPPFALLSL